MSRRSRRFAQRLTHSLETVDDEQMGKQRVRDDAILQNHERPCLWTLEIIVPTRESEVFGTFGIAWMRPAGFFECRFLSHRMGRFVC